MSTFPSPTFQNVTVNGTQTGSVAYNEGSSGAANVTVQSKLQETVSVLDFGADPTGATDSTTAITNAHATGKPVFYPYGTYKYIGYFPSCQGGIIGEGWSANTGAKTTQIVFYNCTSTDTAAITVNQSTPQSYRFTIKDIQIISSSWNGTTGCLGYGLDIGAPVDINNVYVYGFANHNVITHYGTPVNSSAPYESLIRGLKSVYSGGHGCYVGSGSNVMTFENYEGKWNGSTSYGVAPSVAGNYDGMFVDNTSDVLPYTAYVPQGLTIIGGDCSYNSRYGWNFNSLADSSGVCPAYCELNLVNNARVGNNVSYTNIIFGNIANNESGFVNNLVYGPYFYSTAFYIGGKQVHPANVYTFIANPTAADQSGGTIENAPTRTIYTSRDNTGANFCFLNANSTPDGTAVTLASQSVTTLGGTGSGYNIGIGSGSRHLKVGNNLVRLPDQYYQATATGWNAAMVLRGYQNAAPTSGTYTLGSFVWNSAPAQGAPLGWICVSAGTPGNWVPFGAIQSANAFTTTTTTPAYALTSSSTLAQVINVLAGVITSLQAGGSLQ